MPTTAAVTYTMDRLDPMYRPCDVEVHHVKLIASVAYAKGTILGEVTATPGTYRAYLTGAVDGSQVPSCILQYAVATDAGQLHTYGTVSGGGQYGETFPTVPALFSGTYKTSELTGLDAAGVTAWQNAHLLSGSVADGILRIG